MLTVYCLECGSSDLKISVCEKYIICNKCGDRVYIADSDIGIVEVIDE